jgi:hypothetical protein
MIAVQLSAFRLDDNSVVLHPVTVLDVVEEITDDGFDPVEQADRAFWEKKSEPASLAVMDKIVSSLRTDSIEPRLTYCGGRDFPVYKKSLMAAADGSKDFTEDAACTMGLLYFGPDGAQSKNLLLIGRE